MIPRHTADLKGEDFIPYLLSGFMSKQYKKLSMAEIWEPLLPNKVVVPTSTGRYALWYFLEIADLQEGDEVLIAGYNYYVVVRLLVQKGLKPVFVDIDPETLGMDAQDLAKKVTERSKLVVVTHMFGCPANLGDIKRVCETNNLLLFEDCAHAIGTFYQQQQVGFMGDGALFSFGMQKILNTFGGGMLVLDKTFAPRYQPDPYTRSWFASFAETLFYAGSSFFMAPGLYGWSIHPVIKYAMKQAEKGHTKLRDLITPSKDNPDYRFKIDSRAPFQPFMKKMCELQLARLADNVLSRREAVNQLKYAVKDVPAVEVLNEDKYGFYNGSYLGLYVPNPEALTDYLEQNGVFSHPHEFFDCSRLKQFADFKNHCPHAAYASDHIIRLPSYPSLRDEDINKIAMGITRFLSQ